MRILVTGASGLLGLNFSLRAAKTHKILGAVNSRLLDSDIFESYQADLLGKNAVSKLIDETKPDWILNCAAEANIESCDKDPLAAQHLNAEMPGLFAEEAKKRRLPFLHISTDAVFDGVDGAYSEGDPTNPLSVYARTKLAGEQAVAEANPDALIARVNFFGWSLSGKRSLAEFFFNNLSDAKPVNGFKDVLFRPLQVTHLSELILELFEKKLSGVYHVLGAESISKYEFGMRLAKTFGFDEKLIKPISVDESDLQVKRSNKLNLRTEKLEKVLGHSLPSIKEGINLLYEQHQNGYRDNILSLKALV